MVYKKYIKKGGKIYGPYTYHSKRVDGKVVSEYLGRKRKIDYSKFIWLSLGIFLVIFLVYFGYHSFNFGPSGKAILDLETTYYEGEPLEGVLRLSIKEGELIPDSAKIIVETGSGRVSEYTLNELLDEDPIEGNFYAEGKEISGEGKGYGVVGEKKIYPTVYFTLAISPKEIVEKIEVIEEEPETITKEETGEEAPAEEEIVEEEIPTGEEAPTEEEVPENITEEFEEEVTEEEVPVEEPAPEEEIVEEVPSEEEIPAQEVPVEEGEEITGEVVEEEVPEEAAPEAEAAEEAPAEEAPAEEAPITGGFIFQIAGGFLDFFRNIGRGGVFRTGQVALEIEQEIDGQVSGDTSFVYTLEQGKTASIKSGSVKTDSEELSDDAVDLDIDGNNVSVTTNYFEGEPGFGEDYLGDVGKEISIDLSELNVVAEKGELKIRLVYEEQEIISLSTSLEIEGETITATSEIEVEQNITKVAGVVGIVILSEQEKQILVNEFGNVSIKTTKAEVFNNRLIVRHELEQYWVEYSYDYDSTDISDEIESQIQNDKIKWLKDLVVELSKPKAERGAEEVSGLIGEYSIEAGEGSVISEEEVALEEVPVEKEIIEEEVGEEEIPTEEETTPEEEIVETNESASANESI